MSDVPCTMEGKAMQFQREMPSSNRHDSRKLTNYLAIRWQRAPNLQVFSLLLRPSM